jgi:hypothetical protein
MKFWEVLEYLSEWQLLKKGSAPWGYTDSDIRQVYEKVRAMYLHLCSAVQVEITHKMIVIFLFANQHCEIA